MTAAELTCEILDRRNIPIKEKDYWSCWEISVKEEMGEGDQGRNILLDIPPALGEPTVISALPSQRKNALPQSVINRQAWDRDTTVYGRLLDVWTSGGRFFQALQTGSPSSRLQEGDTLKLKLCLSVLS